MTGTVTIQTVYPVVGALDDIPKNCYRLKKDALYKPLLRKFRNFFRKLIDVAELSKGCHHWTSDKLRNQVLGFMNFLELPAHFMNEMTFCSMVVILFPTIIKKKTYARQSLPEIDLHFSKIRHLCYDVF